MGDTKPYPGYDNHPSAATPRANTRVKPEAEQFAQNGRGSLNLFSDNPKYVDEVMPTPRCGSYDARQNYEHGRHGTVNALLHGEATPRADADAVPRVKYEAEPIAEGHRGKQTAALFNSYGQLPRSARNAPRIKAEAEETAEQHLGGRMNCLLHDPKKLPISARPEPRVKGEASANAELDRGGQMNKTLHSYGSLSSRPDYVPRVKPEANDNAEKGKGVMGNLMGKYGKLPLSARPSPKVNGEGIESANLDKGGRMSRLMYEGDRLPRDSKPPPRATTKEARHILKQNRGQIGQLLSAQGRKQTVSAPGLRRSMVKSY